MAKKSRKLDNQNVENSILSEMKDQFSSMNSNILSYFQQLIKHNEELMLKVNQQALIIEEQLSKINELVAEINELVAENQKLKEQVGKNSKNSSKPSSSNFFNKPKASKINKGDSTQKRTSGGQVGHKGNTFIPKETPDEIVTCLPEKCNKCQFKAKCSKLFVKHESRVVADMIIQIKETRYDSMCIKCPQSKEFLVGAFPCDVKTTMQYGNNLKALVVTLGSFGMVSVSRIAEMINAISGYNISEGTICNMMEAVGTEALVEREKIADLVKKSPVIHVDETGLRSKGKVGWAHTASNEHLTHIHFSTKRGNEGSDQAQILPNYTGIMTHDCFSSYFKYNQVIHVLCNSHLDRELQGVIDFANPKWAIGLQETLKEMHKTRKIYEAKGFMSVPEDVYEKLSKRYDKFVNQGLKENPIIESLTSKRGRPKKGKIRSLLDRLVKYKDYYLYFLRDFRVAFSNNLAERSFRLFKVKGKVGGSFRSENGADLFAAIWSIIDTARKNSISGYQAIKDLISRTSLSDKIKGSLSFC